MCLHKNHLDCSARADHVDVLDQMLRRSLDIPLELEVLEVTPFRVCRPESSLEGFLAPAGHVLVRSYQVGENEMKDIVHRYALLD